MNDPFVLPDISRLANAEHVRGWCFKCKRTTMIRSTQPPGCGPTGLCADCDDGQAPTWTSII